MLKKSLVLSTTILLLHCFADEADISFDEISVTGQKQIYHDKPELKTYTKAGSYSYVDQTQIQRFRGSSVGDFLSGIPGVIIGNKRNSGGISVNIRGLQNEGRVLVKIDDNFQAIPTYQGYAGSSTRTFLDPDLISSVEVEKGPSFAYDGVGAIGGVVRMSTLNSDDIIPENSNKDWGLRFRAGTMSNTTSRPALYTRGGYQKYGVIECLRNDSGLCKPISHSPDSRYQSSNLLNNLFDSYNTSLAFTKKWEHGDIVLAYARKKQGNYFAGKHGQTPEIEKIEEDTKHYNDFSWYNPPFKGYLHEVGDDRDILRLSKAEFKNKTGYTYFRAGEEALNSWQDNKSFLAKANLYNDFHAFNATYTRYRSEFGELMPSVSQVMRDDGIGTGSIEGDGSKVKADSISTKYQYNPDNPYINLNFSTYLTKVDYESYTRRLGRPGYAKDGDAYILRSDLKGISLYNTSVLDFFNRPLKLTYGVSYSTERIKEPTDAFARVISKGYAKDDKEANMVIGDLNRRNAKRKEASAFIYANYSPIDWLTLDVGGRYIRQKTIDYRPFVLERGDEESKLYARDFVDKEEYYRQCEMDPMNKPSEAYMKRPQYKFIGGRPVLLTDQEKIDKFRQRFMFSCNRQLTKSTKPTKNSNFSPMAMVTFTPLENWQIYIKYAKAARPASLFQATRGAGMTKNELETEPLRVEKITNLEIGTNFLQENILSNRDIFGIKFSYFQNNIDDYLTRRSRYSNRTGVEGFFFNTINIESAKYEGFEAQTYYDMGDFYISANLTYYLDTEFCLYPNQVGPNGQRCFSGGLSGSNISNTLPPKYIATATIGARLFNKKLDIGARYSHYGKRAVSIFETQDTEIGNTNSAEWDDYGLVDLYADYKINDNLTISAAIDNLTNKYYLDVNNMSLSPAPGRTLHLNLDYKF